MQSCGGLWKGWKAYFVGALGLVNVAWVVLHCNRRIGARERRQLIPHVRFQVPFLRPESQLKSGFACAGLLCKNVFMPQPSAGNTVSWLFIARWTTGW